jgi:esterase/lipase
MHLPSLVINADADTGVFPSQAKTIFDAIATPDKQLRTLHGDHYFQEPRGARDEVADLVTAWVSAH